MENKEEQRVRFFPVFFLFQVDGMRVMDVREAVKFARDYALRNGPILLEMVTYRYFGHSMSDPGTSYRTRDEVKKIQAERDPIELLTKLLVENGVKTEAEILVRPRARVRLTFCPLLFPLLFTLA